jgi:glyoxylase-like metal-dependent hydrolase (beta-lactamase superfamily II)
VIDPGDAGRWLALRTADVAPLPCGELVYRTEEFFAPSRALPGYDSMAAEIGEQIKLPVACFLIRSATALILVDSGLPHRERRNRLVAKLAGLGVDPRDVDYVVLTHLHSDHVGGLVDDSGRPAFPRALHLCHDRELRWHEGRTAQDRAGTSAPLNAVSPLLEPIAGTVTALTDDVVLTLCPGHTPGHLTIEIGRQRDRVDAWVIADMFHIPSQVRRPDLVGFADEDGELVRQQRVEALARVRSTDVWFASHLPGHVGRIVSGDGEARWRSDHYSREC